PELAKAKPGDLHSARLPHLRAVIQVGGPAFPGTIPFEDVATMGGARHKAQLAELAATLQFDDPVNIQFTSGTTGSPKGVTLTHKHTTSTPITNKRPTPVRPDAPPTPTPNTASQNNHKAHNPQQHPKHP